MSLPGRSYIVMGPGHTSMMFLYSVALTSALLLSAPVWGWRMLRQGRYRAGLRDRLGSIPERVVRSTRGRPLVWLHAVSVGEVQAASRLVEEMRAALPGYAIVVSTTTPTGQQVARERFGVDNVFFYPLDFAFAVRTYLRVLQPRLVVLMESELWPRMIVECARRGIPVAVVNARVSDRSLPRYMALRALWRPLLRRISLLLAQSDEDARRWRAIGVPAGRVFTTGNLKYDVRVPQETPLTVLLRKHLPTGVKVLVCGSTHEGEEVLLLDCWRKTGLEGVMILAPRHPERAAQVEQLAAARAFHLERLSAWRLAPAGIASGAVLLVDTVGELASLYALATIAFVGGSLVPRGGQNPLEAGRFGVPVIMGPSYENFREVVHGMRDAGALHLADSREICTALQTHLQTAGDGELCRNVLAYVEANGGATARTLAALTSLLNETAL